MISHAIALHQDVVRVIGTTSRSPVARAFAAGGPIRCRLRSRLDARDHALAAPDSRELRARRTRGPGCARRAAALSSSRSRRLPRITSSGDRTPRCRGSRPTVGSEPGDATACAPRDPLGRDIGSSDRRAVQCLARTTPPPPPRPAPLARVASALCAERCSSARNRPGASHLSSVARCAAPRPR